MPSTGGTPGPCKGLSPVSSGATRLISRGALWKQALGGGSCEARERPWAAVELRSELRRWERDGGGRLGGKGVKAASRNGVASGIFLKRAVSKAEP